MILSYHRFHDVHPPTHRPLSAEVTPQPLGSGAELWEGTGELHEIRLRHRGLLHHNIFIGVELRDSERQAKIGGLIHTYIMKEMDLLVGTIALTGLLIRCYMD